jgi:histidinol dehydrogenase
MRVSPIENHRSREEGLLVYPVHSRRSGGLSLGINLFPDRKICAFDCPYCEVFPFKTGARFELETMKSGLVHALQEAEAQNIAVRDICFSGNGEPTLSTHFPQALEVVIGIRAGITGGGGQGGAAGYAERGGAGDSGISGGQGRAACNGGRGGAPDEPPAEQPPRTKIVVITNGTCLLNDALFALLAGYAQEPFFHLWLKLDAGTEAWYKRIDRSEVPFAALTEKIRAFVKISPVTIQTMLCKINGALPPEEELSAWENAALTLAATGNVREFHLYGKARPAPEDPLAEAAPAAYLESRAASLSGRLLKAGINAPRAASTPAPTATPIPPQAVPVTVFE